MKIGITGFPTMGGSGLIATRLGLELAKHDIEVHFLFYKRPFFLDTTTPENVYFHRIDQPDYELFQDIGSPYTIQAASIIARVVREFGLDILHAHYTIPHAVVAYLVNQITPIKTVVTAHGSDTHSLGHQAAYQEVISLALQQASCVTSVSDYLSNETMQLFGLGENCVKTIYDFVNPMEFTPTGQPRNKTIIQASNFREIKQLPMLIDCFAGAVKQHPDWRLQLVGNGPEWPKCVRQARALGIKDKVEFLGIRRDLPSLFSQASILGSSSRIESFGLTIAEGMASELPVWAPNVGGIPELCKDNETGLLYDPSDLDQAIDTMDQLMSDADLRERFGKAGRKRILDHFSTDVIIGQYVELYEQLLDVEQASQILE